ncbi:ricin-type beta-trefoil lectin domain protein [Streptomyces sp. NPDC093516]|uniref:ricin-type beta-trefoil lectin domain protein n=1 Tax=Streptomyces sp. NPDC093516 TaxID=3155304 RepID=UPI0034435CC0
MSVPRLSRVSSLSSRTTGRRATGADTPAAGDGNWPDKNNAPRPGTGRRTAAPPFGTLQPAEPKEVKKPRREGLRGALGVVGVVGLLAVGGVALTLGLAHGGDDAAPADSSVPVNSTDDRADFSDGLGDLAAPSARASASAPGTTPDGSASPTATATGKASTGTAKDDEKPHTKATAQAPVSGVGVYSHASHRCIDIVGGKAVQGAPLMIWDCNGSASQHWTFTGGTMRSLGMCVQLAGGSTADGAGIELGACNGSANQKFILNSRHDLVSSLADKCTDVRDDKRANGTRLQLWSCSGTDNQKWSSS